MMSQNTEPTLEPLSSCGPTTETILFFSSQTVTSFLLSQCEIQKLLMLTYSPES